MLSLCHKLSYWGTLRPSVACAKYEIPGYIPSHICTAATLLVLQMLDRAHADMFSLRQQLRDTQLALLDSQHDLEAAADSADDLRVQLQNLKLLQQQQGEQQQKQQQQQADNMAGTPSTCKAQVGGCPGVLGLPSSIVTCMPLSFLKGDLAPGWHKAREVNLSAKRMQRVS